MCEEYVHHRLRQTRIQRGESREQVARRAGVRVEWLQAIEEGRFQDLPGGIYGRSAVRGHARALGLDANEILEACGALLPRVEDPIAAMQRLNGTARPRANKKRKDSASGAPDWRLIAAPAIDAAAMAVALLVVVTGTVAMGVPVAALDRAAAVPLFILMVILTACYFVVFGGVIGRTAGECLTGLHPPSPTPARLDLRAVAVRTGHSIARDSCFIERLGEWFGHLAWGGVHWTTARFHSDAQAQTK